MFLSRDKLPHSEIYASGFSDHVAPAAATECTVPPAMTSMFHLRGKLSNSPVKKNSNSLMKNFQNCPR